MWNWLSHRKRYRSVDEFYRAVEQLIGDLRANGRETEASRLEVLLRGAWTTGSELIGELMLALADMEGIVPKEFRKRVGDCRYFAKHHRRILGLD